MSKGSRSVVSTESGKQALKEEPAYHNKAGELNWYIQEVKKRFLLMLVTCVVINRKGDPAYGILLFSSLL